MVLDRFADLLYNVGRGAAELPMSNTGSVMDETGAIFTDLQNISVNRGHFYDEALHLKSLASDIAGHLEIIWRHTGLEQPKPLVRFSDRRRRGVPSRTWPTCTAVRFRVVLFGSSKSCERLRIDLRPPY